MANEAEARIEQALIDWFRRATDPRGNADLKARSGVDLERAASTLLARVGEHEPARLSDIAAATGVDVSTASRTAARLVEQGYIERSTDPVDARASLLRLTPDGKDALNRLTEARHEWLREILAEFQPADRAQFADLLERFVTRMIAASG